MALVIVLLLSMLKIELTLAGENSVQLDLSDARALAVVAFLIGLNPFMVWDDLRRRSGTLFGQVQRRNDESMLLIPRQRGTPATRISRRLGNLSSIICSCCNTL